MKKQKGSEPAPAPTGASSELKTPRVATEVSESTSSVAKPASLAKPTKAKAPAPKEKLSPRDRRAFERCNSIVTVGLATMIKSAFEVGEAIRRVRDNRLYREDFATFEDYCSTKFAIGRTYAYALADAAKIKEDLSAMADIPLPENERQVRPLLKLRNRPEDLKSAWQNAVALAGEKTVTEKHVSQAVKAILHPPHQADQVEPNEEPEQEPWRVRVTTRFLDAAYEEAFEQPIRWPGDAVHLIARDQTRFVKFIDELTLDETACAAELIKKGIHPVVIINAAANSPDGIIHGVGGKTIEDSFDLGFNLLAKEIGAFIEFSGTLYRPGEITDTYDVTWEPLSSGDLAVIFPSTDEPRDGGGATNLHVSLAQGTGTAAAL